MRAAIVIIVVLLCAAVWYGLKLQEPCTAKGGRIVNKDNGFHCVDTTGRVLD